MILFTELVPRESIVQWIAALREEHVVIGLERSKDTEVTSTPTTKKKQLTSSPPNKPVEIDVDALKRSLVLWAAAKAKQNPEPLKVAVVGLVNASCPVSRHVITYPNTSEWKVDGYQLIGT